MDFSIAAILTQDGITTGAVYALLALGLVLVFAVTRVIFIPGGEVVTYAALTMAAMQAGLAPKVVYLSVALGAMCWLADAWGCARQKVWAGFGRSTLGYIVVPLVLVGLGLWVPWNQLPLLVQLLGCLALLAPLGPMLYRLAFQPIQHASTLVLLIASVAVHEAMLGLGLVMFGAEGARTARFSDQQWDLGSGVTVSAQSALIVLACFVVMAVFALFFGRTLAGKALRATAVNRVGAQLVGISTERAGQLAFIMACAVSGLCGILIGPITTVYYDTGFIIGLKGFVGAIIGGLVSYPVAAAGALLVGLLEAFSSFWSSANKEVLVFSLILPVLAWRSLRHVRLLDDDEE